jgi:hypothetical protein
MAIGKREPFVPAGSRDAAIGIVNSPDPRVRGKGRQSIYRPAATAAHIQYLKVFLDRNVR